MDGDRNCVYDIGSGVDLLSPVGGWVERWMHYGGRGAVLRREVSTYVDISFIFYTEVLAYASFLALIVQIDSELAGAAPITHSLQYIAFMHPFGSLRLSTNLK